MKTPTLVISAPEAAIFIYSKLGSLRAWTDFLGDCIRFKTNLYGLTLLPCGKKHDGRASRPVYSVTDIRQFIADVKRANPSACRLPIKPVTLAIDNCKSWRLNEFDRLGAPMAITVCGF